MAYRQPLLAVLFASLAFPGAAQSLTPNPSNTIYDFFISGPATANVNGGATIAGTASLSASGYGMSTAGTGPGFMVQTVPLNSLFFSGPGGISGESAMPGVFRQVNANPLTFPMSGGMSMSIDGISLTGNFNLLDVFGFTLNAGVSCIDCTSTFITEQGAVINFQFAGGPVITALERAAATGVPPVPEPATLVLMSGGLAILSSLARRHRGRSAV